mgnify:CR=1 FL=1
MNKTGKVEKGKTPCAYSGEPSEIVTKAGEAVKRKYLKQAERKNLEKSAKQLINQK